MCHGLSLNLGGPAPLDEAFLHKVRQFLDTFNVRCYSEHLSYCGDDGHLYDLMPIPFHGRGGPLYCRQDQARQDIIGRRLAIENVSYYAAPGQEVTETEFINNVLAEADCDLLLDVNNIYVNSINHRYDAEAWLKSVPAERIAYAHVAGHYVEAEDLRVDTHGADVIDPVWKLLEAAYAHFGVFPTLLERDFNIPPLPELLGEVGRIRRLQSDFPFVTHCVLPWTQPCGAASAVQIGCPADLSGESRNPVRQRGRSEPAPANAGGDTVFHWMPGQARHDGE